MRRRSALETSVTIEGLATAAISLETGTGGAGDGVLLVPAAIVLDCTAPLGLRS